MVGKGIVIADIVLLNAGVGYLLYKSQITNTNNQINPNIQNPNTYTYLDIDNKLEELKQEILAEVKVAGQSGTPVPSLTPEPTTASNQSKSKSMTVLKTKIRKVDYVTIPGSGQSTSFAWSNVTGTDFYFDKSDYPGLVEVYFEATVSLFNGNGTAYIRLYDVTHGIGVQGSDIQTASQTPAINESGKLTFWAGKNLYRIQAKTLTSDTAIYSNGRLRIVTEN